MGNGYKGIKPKLSGRQRLYLELTGVTPSSNAYKNLCDWFAQEWGEPEGKAQCEAMQLKMLERVFPNMLGELELAEYLRRVLTDGQGVWAELVIQRYGLDGGEYRKMTELTPEFARKYHYTENTVKTMLSRTLDTLQKDAHFREALVVPKLTSDLLNYWKFVCILLTGSDKRVEQVDWDEETAVAALEELQKIGVKCLSIADQAVENWLSTLPEEARLATKMMYGLGYPAIERDNDYIMKASGFDLKQRNLLDYLRVKLNRASLCAIFGVEITEVDYWRLKKDLGIERAMIADIESLGLPSKVAMALREAEVPNASALLALDMNSEEEQPWTKCVPSKYWPDVVQLWIDLRIEFEIGDYEFNGGYVYQQKVS